MYDPAPRKRKVTAKRTGKKGTLGKLKKFAIPAAAGVTFLASYSKRAQDLFAAGKIDEKSIYKAIKYDLENFDSSAAMQRLQGQAGEIAAPLIGGWAVKETKLLGKYSGLAGDILIGLGIGTGAKAVLDPPINQGNNSMKVITVDPVKSNCPGCKQTAVSTGREYNPYMPGGY